MIPTGGCALANLIAGEDPIGSATPFDQLFLIQIPPPWERIALDTATVPDGVRTALVPAAKAGRRAYVLLIDGDAPLAHDEMRVIAYRKLAGPAGSYLSSEHLVPRGRTAEAIEALSAQALGAKATGDVSDEPQTIGVDALAHIPGTRRLPDPGRDLFVCTHGERDGCCGSFGEAAYRHLRAAGLPTETRAWRISHFGGHRFAPTLVDMPTGRVWGKLNEAALHALLHRSGPVADLRAMYRGWCALHPAGQIVERELLLEHGWGWTGARVDVAVNVPNSTRDGVYDVQLSAQLPSGAPVEARARIVERDPLVLPLSCGADERVVPQYAFAAEPAVVSSVGAGGSA